MKRCPLCSTDYASQYATCPTDGATLTEVRAWEPGAIIKGKYRILSRLGEGGMGTVYKAIHIGLEEVRALKVMSAALTGDPQFVKRFRQEAQAARRLRHVNAVHVDDLDQADDGSLFIAMDYVDGASLRHLLNATKGPLPVELALAIARGVAEGLEAAHALGMVHRDIKPENIMLARDAQGRDVPKILDFGIVAMKETSATLTTQGLMLTPAYASPEQWRGTPASGLDGRTDLYALGGVLYEMLTGLTPFHAQNSEGWMFQQLHEAPKPPSNPRPELGQVPGLDALVLRLLAKDREGRPASAHAFLQELNLLEARRYATTPPLLPTEIEVKISVAAAAGADAGRQQAERTALEGPRYLDRMHGRSRQSDGREAWSGTGKGAPKIARGLLAAALVCALVGLCAWLWRNSHPPVPTPATAAASTATPSSFVPDTPLTQLTAPAASLAANPQAIDAGQAVTLTWNTSNATDVRIEGVGTVEPNGTRTLHPTQSTSYRLTAKGPGGSADSAVRVEVSPPAQGATGSVVPVPTPKSGVAVAPQPSASFFRFRHLSSGDSPPQQSSPNPVPYNGPAPATGPATAQPVVSTLPPKRPPSPPRVESFSGYLVPGTDQYVRIVSAHFPSGVDDKSLAYYFKTHLGAPPQTSDDFHATRLLKLEAREQLDVPVAGCNNAVVVTIEYHFEDLRGSRLAGEPAGVGTGHQCTDRELSQVEKLATEGAIAEIRRAIFDRRP
jgi:serine/threonine protein kinase